MNSLGVPFHYCPEAKETINLIHSMFFHMSIFKLVHISILMYLIQRESLPKTALYKQKRTPSPHPLVVTLSSQTTFNQSSLKNDLVLKKQNNKRRNYDIVVLIHSVYECAYTAGASSGTEMHTVALTFAISS